MVADERATHHRETAPHCRTGAADDDGIDDLAVTSRYYFLTVLVSRRETVGPCPADLDDDGRVGFQDLVRVLVAWDSEGGPEDLDGDCRVGFADVVVVLSAWGACD